MCFSWSWLSFDISVCGCLINAGLFHWSVCSGREGISTWHSAVFVEGVREGWEEGRRRKEGERKEGRVDGRKERMERGVSTVIGRFASSCGTLAKALVLSRPSFLCQMKEPVNKC